MASHYTSLSRSIHKVQIVQNTEKIKSLSFVINIKMVVLTFQMKDLRILSRRLSSSEFRKDNQNRINVEHLSAFSPKLVKILFQRFTEPEVIASYL